MSHYNDLYLAYQQQLYSTLTVLAGFTVLLTLGWFAGYKLIPPTWLHRFQAAYLIWCALLYAGLVVYSVR